MYCFEPKTNVTNSSIIATDRGPGSAFTKVRFLNTLISCFSRIKGYFLVNTIAEFGSGTLLTHRIDLFSQYLTPESCQIPSKRDLEKESWTLFY